MKKTFYPKLAFEGIKKNRRLYLPYLFTCVLMVAMFYILSFLSRAEILDYVGGGGTLKIIMNLGSFVIAVFSVIFLFYTNSFLIRRRKKEFGLYNILGMNKHNIGRILLFESLIIGVFSLLCGLILGIALSKLAELGLVNIVNGKISFDFWIDFVSVRNTVILFTVIFLLIFLNALRQVHFSNPMQLLRSENVGEKPPRANWVLGILGIVILGVAYYLAVSIKQPIEAIIWFFIAVILVIIATYMLMIAGSVLLCRILQKNKKYYYNPRHFVSVSSMVYRMKRNGAGLASICILLTMVLVMISSTACLYFGAEDSLNSRYPRDISVRVDYSDMKSTSEENISLLRSTLENLADSHSASRDNLWDYRDYQISGLLLDGNLEIDVTSVNEFDLSTYDNLITVHFVPLEDYNRMTGENVTLSSGEAMAYPIRIKQPSDRLTIGTTCFSIVRFIDSMDVEGSFSAEVIPSMYVIVPDVETAVAPISNVLDFNGEYMLRPSWYYGFDTDLTNDDKIALNDDIKAELRQMQIDNNSDIYSSYCECIWAERQDFYGVYGGLFFLGIMLSIVFLVAAVLIIYYKQISEGYEDQSRFHIMQKVGMTKADIRHSINSQMLTVFFLPIIFAVLHLSFAFPMIRKLLLLFNLNNLPLLIITTAISIIVFALFYMIVYRITSNIYYSIVSGNNEDN